MLREKMRDPTPSEIEKACKKIQAGWTEKQELVRSSASVCELHLLQKTRQWTPPVIPLSEIVNNA